MSKSFLRKLLSFNKTALSRSVVVPEEKRHKKLFGNSTTGFTILEVVIATFIITVSSIAVFTLIIRTTSESAITNNKLVASYLAQEGIEIVRNIRDTNFLKIRKGGTISWDEGIIDPDGIGPNECATQCRADYNDNALIADPGGPLLRDSTTNIYSYDGGNPTIFTREIIAITNVTNDKIEVEVKIEWEERGQSREVVVVSELFNWMATP